MKLYTLPPVKLISVVLYRIKTCGVYLILVAPFWSSQTWFSGLTSLLEGDLWEIPIRKNFGTHIQRSGSCGCGRSEVAHKLRSLGWSPLSLFHQSSSIAVSDPKPSFKPVLCLSTPKAPALNQEKWFASSTKTLLG